MDGRPEDPTGTGGKIARRPFRTRPSPYARPPRVAAPQRRESEGWFSKLVVRPAAWVLPSLFSSLTGDEDPSPSESSPENAQEALTSLAENMQEDVDGESKLDHEDGFPESKVLDASVVSVPPKVELKNDGHVEDKGGDANKSIRLTEIEKRLKHKTYSRDESARLIELLRSRTTDLYDDNEHTAGFTVKEARSCQEVSKTLVKEDVLDHQIVLKTFEPFQLAARDISSPVDIAKAYMEGQKSASGYDRHNGTMMNERKLTDGDVSALSPGSAMKSSICAPGAIVQSDHGYMTPQVQRGRIGLRNFSRSPYSGGIYSRSTSKFQGVGERSNLLSAGWKQSHTPVFGRITNSKSSVLNNGPMQVDPIRHVRQKNMATTASERTGSSCAPTFPWSDISSTYHKLERGSSKGPYGGFRSTHEDGAASTSMFGSTVHPQSSRMAKKILEHLDRSVSPKEKSKELELALSRLDPPKSTASSIEGPDKRPDVRVSDGFLLGREMGTRESEHPPKVISGPSTSKSRAVAELFKVPKSQRLSGSGVVSEPNVGVESSGNGLGFTFPDPPASYLSSEPPTPNMSPSRAASEELPTSDKTVGTFNFGTYKAKSSDNGFTFPIPPPSSDFSELPPTPTMSSPGAVNRALPLSGDNTVPTFNFGNPKADGRLVFSFGSIAGPAVTDVEPPMFKFGSDEKRELSFKSVTKDAICFKF